MREKVALFRFSNDGADQKTIGVRLFQGRQLDCFVSSVNEITTMEPDDAVPTLMRKDCA